MDILALVWKRSVDDKFLATVYIMHTTVLSTHTRSCFAECSKAFIKSAMRIRGWRRRHGAFGRGCIAFFGVQNSGICECVHRRPYQFNHCQLPRSRRALDLVIESLASCRSHILGNFGNVRSETLQEIIITVGYQS